MLPPIGFTGLGRMGQAMVLRLLSAGFPVHVWNREPDRIPAVVERGAVACASPAEVAEGAEIVLSSLLDADAVEAVVFGPDGIASGRRGGLFVDHASIPPDATRALAARLEAANGMRWVDAPVSGSVVGVERGSLAIFCGGDEADVERVRPALAAYGANITRMGPVGAGQSTKLCNQILVATTMCAVAEAVRLAQDEGIDASRLPEVLAGGAADSPLLRLLVPRMLERPTDSLGAASVLLKDLDAVLAAAAVDLPLTTAAAERFRAMVAAGLGGEDTSRLVDLWPASGPR